MLRLLTAELSLRAREFLPVARTAVVADPAPAGRPGGRRRDARRSPARVAPPQAVHRTAPSGWPREGIGTRLGQYSSPSLTRGFLIVPVRYLAPAAAGLALLAPAASPGAPWEPVARHEGSVRAADLLARVRDCAPVSRGGCRTDAGRPASVPVCGTEEAVFWKADMDIACDGRPGTHCNSATDPAFWPATAFTQSDGRYLSAEDLPYIVVPGVSDIWNHRDHGVRGGAVAAVLYQDRVQYAVVGDVGPQEIIGEASYATAQALGIHPDPRGGGVPSGVTYIVFRNSRAAPIESHASAVEVGERLALLFVRGEADGVRRSGVPLGGQPFFRGEAEAG